jgi:thioesterase domain-containing protein
MSQSRDEGIVSTLIKKGTGSYTVCMSGVLARGRDQFQPIANYLPGWTTAYHTEGKQFHVDELIGQVVEDLLQPIDYGYPINIVGASMGSMLAPFVVQRLREIGKVDPEQLKVVLVDAPCGLDSLSDGNAKFLGMPVIGQTIASVVSLLGIDVPDEITVTGDKQRIVDVARFSLSGHKLALLFRQTQWMIEVGRDGSLVQAVTSLEDVDTTYLHCHMGASPVKQPVAVNWWEDELEDLKVINVEATHCGFLQNTPEFAKAFAMAFE